LGRLRGGEHHRHDTDPREREVIVQIVGE